MVTLVIFDVSGTLRDGRGKLFDGLFDVLHHLHRRGITLAIASSLSVGGIRRFLDDNGVEDLFSCIKSADQAEPKPHPMMLEKILLETATAPEDAVMIGDSPDDIVMARAAGVASIAALWRDGLVLQQCVDLRPQAMLHSVDDILTAV